MLATIGLILIVGSLFILATYRYRRRRMCIFEEMKVPGPKPQWLLGNLGQIGKSQKLFSKQMEWTKQFGSIWGFYEGPTPVLIVSDLDFLHEVFVKKFHYFSARKIFPLQPDPEKDHMVHMFFAYGSRWKRLRNIIAPSFSTSKMRAVVPYISKCTDAMMQSIDKGVMGDNEIDIYEYFQQLTLNIISEAAFGISFEDSDYLLKDLKDIFAKGRQEQPLTAILTLILPEFHGLFRRLFELSSKLRNNPLLALYEKMEEVIRSRQQSVGKRTDLLQYMLDANSTQSPPSTPIPSPSPFAFSFSFSSPACGPSGLRGLSVNSEDSDLEGSNGRLLRGRDSSSSSENDDATSRGRAWERALSTEEVKAQCYLFLLAGYETSSNTLAFATYCLASNPHVQEKLQLEIDTVFGRNPVITYADLNRLPYMDMVIQETMRLYPIASTVLNRRCVRPVKIGDILLPPGLIVQPDMWTIHHDPSIWGPEDPYSFCPERFTEAAKKNRHPMAWLAFGAGPRNCVGRRLAALEVKAALVKLLSRYHIKLSSKTKVPIELNEGATVSPREGVFVNLQLRDETRTDECVDMSTQ